MPKIFLFILVCALMPLRSFATVYRWVSTPCQISGTQQDSTSDISSLARIEFTLNASYMEDSDGNRKLLKKGVRMERNPKIPEDQWNAVYTKFIPYIANWVPENTDGYDPAFLTQIDVEFETIYRLLMAMGGNRLKMSHNLEIPDMEPLENGLYALRFWLGEEHRPVQMHLPLNEENGLSHHLEWGCGNSYYSTKPIELGDTTEHTIEPLEPFFPVLESNKATFDEKGFIVSLKSAPERAVHQRFRYDDEAWSDWLEVSDVISYMPSDVNKFIGKHVLAVQYMDAAEIKSSPMRAIVHVEPPEYIKAPLKADFKRIQCYSGGAKWYAVFRADLRSEFVQYRWPGVSEEWSEISQGGISITVDAEYRSCDPIDGSAVLLEVKDKFGFIKAETVYFY